MPESLDTNSLEASDRKVNRGWNRRKVGSRVLLGVIVLAGVAALLMKQRGQHEVCIVNGIYEPLVVQIDDIDPVTVTPNSNLLVLVKLASGNHVAEVISPDSFRSKKEFSIPRSRWSWQSKKPMWVLDPTETASQTLNRITYQFNGTDFEWIDNSKVCELEDRLLTKYAAVDFLNEDLPEKLSVQEAGQSNGEVIKQRLSVYPLSDVNNSLTTSRTEKRRREVKLLLTESYMRANPDSISGFENLLKLSLAADIFEPNDVIETLLARRPVNVEMHRKFQNGFANAQFDRDALVRRYDDYLQVDRENSKLLYLRGRLEATVAPGNDYFKKAIESDPQNKFALYALGRNYMSACEFTKAKEVFRRLVELEPEDEAYQSEYVRSLYAAKDFAELRKRVKFYPSTTQEFYFAAHFFKLTDQEDQFSQIKANFLNNPNTRLAPVPLVNAYWAYLNGEIASFEESILKSRVYDDSDRWAKRLQIGIETGDVSDLPWLLERLPKTDRDQTLPMMAVVLKRAGKHKEAQQIWDQFVDRMAKRQGAEKLLAELAKEGMSKRVNIEEFRQLAIWALHKRVYALGFREFTKDAGPEWGDEVRALNFERWFPYTFVENAINENSINEE